MITITCDYCHKSEEFKGQYVPEDWHIASFDPIISDTIFKHICPECYKKMKEAKMKKVRE